jgi:hypothetical protein
MTRQRIAINVAACIMIALVTALILGAAPARAEFEEPPVFTASDILEPGQLSGPNHKVDHRVANDGFMNHYTIQSRFGTFEAGSNAELTILIREINAIAAMDKAESTEEFQKALEDSGADLASGAKDLITKPDEAVSGAVSGVKTLFRRTGDGLFGDPASQAEDGALKGIVGFTSTKREIAAHFKVDPYSSNEIFQKKLDDLAWASYSGGLSFSALKMLIPGGLGMAVSVTGNINLLNESLVKTPPGDLRRMNREALTKMGVNGDVIDIFMGNTVFSPTRQTMVVEALKGMEGVADRDEMVKLAALAKTTDETLFRLRQVQMYQGYHHRVEKINRFEPVGGVAAARSASDSLVFVIPLDHLAWTRDMARLALGVLSRIPKDNKDADRQFWFGGGISSLARKSLEAEGWKVHHGVEDQLLKQSQ